MTDNKYRSFAGIATIPERENILKAALDSIAPQVDGLGIILNQYTVVPEWLGRLPKKYPHLKGRFFTGCIYGRNFGDAGKFFWDHKLDDSYDIYFSIDDDLIYPPDYVERSIEKLQAYNMKAVISYHGRIMQPRPISQYYRQHTWKHNCLNGCQAEDRGIDVPGSGVACWARKEMIIPYNEINLANMGDIWLARFARQRDLDIILAAHPDGWFKYLNPGGTIYDKYYQDSSLQAELYNNLLKIS